MKPRRAKADAATPAHANSETRRYTITRRATVKPTKRERVMLAYDDAVQSLAPGIQFSALKGNLTNVLHKNWSMAAKIEFFEQFAADSRRIAR
jgi:hypothetical protein